MSVKLWSEGPAYIMSWIFSVHAHNNDYKILGEHTVGQSPAMRNSMEFHGIWTDFWGRCREWQEVKNFEGSDGGGKWAFILAFSL